jgi:hypothetical protein
MSWFNAIEKESKSYERFLKRITIASSGCWEMNGFHDRDGYAQFHKHKGNSKAHRISYEWHKCKIPQGFTIDHLCKNTGCVNPDHLETVTIQENSRRHNAEGYKKWWNNLSANDKAAFVNQVSKKASQIAATKKLNATHCRRGHEWKPESTYIVPKSGHRRCNVCFMETRKRSESKRTKTLIISNS